MTDLKPLHDAVVDGNAKVAKAPAKPPVPETGDKLTDLSSRKARYSESVKSAQEEKAQIEKAEADRKKTLEQLTG